jgi:hypothetical protein
LHKYHLWPEDPLLRGDVVELAATLEKSSQERQRIWFRMPSSQLPIFPGNLDSFVVAVLFTLIEAQADLEIHGEVSPSLLFNLAEFQKAWALWLPDKYHSVDFSAATEREHPRLEKKEVIMGFSGGVDSAFTAWRHRMNRSEREPWTLSAGVMVHGFDIPIDQPEVFANAAEKSRIMLSSIGMNLMPVSTNLRQLHNKWDDSHGAALAACLMLFKGRYNAGLIASSYPYNNLIIPWGSNPLTDQLLSSDSFRVIHDGSAFTRVDKMRQIGDWPEAMQYLRVCWEGHQKDRNCCRCQKCVSNMLTFSALGHEAIPAFPFSISDREIRRLKYSDNPSLQSTRRLIKLLKSLNFRSSSTIKALKISVKINRVWQAGWKISLAKNALKLFERWWFLNPRFVGESKEPDMAIQ